MRWLIGFTLVVVVASGCAASPTATPTMLDPVTTTSVLTVSPSSTALEPRAAPSPSSTITSTSSTTSIPDPCPEKLDSAGDDIPAELDDQIQQLLSGTSFDDLDVSFSASIDSYRGTIEHNAGLALLPASNQKIITAFGVAELLDLEDRFVTQVHQFGLDLHLVASGDPSLTRASLAAMADSVAASDVTEVRTLYVVAGKYTTGVSAPGWQDWQLPTYVGPLSALMVDDNRYRTDAKFVAEPALSNAQLFADLLRDRNVAVLDVTEWDPFDDTRPATPNVLATIESSPFGELAATMLLSSDNQNADQLMNEIGYRLGSFEGGSIADGTVATAEALDTWCLDLTGKSGDGSGLSRHNWRSAGEFRRLLDHARTEPWFDWFKSSLPVAGRTGTLSSRFNNTPAVGRVRAKTGSIIGGKALSGYGTTVGGHDFVFSILVNGEPQKVIDAQAAMDAVITELAQH